jgi:hypothetical protein
MKTIKLAGLNALLAIALLGTACTPAAAPTPTIDPNMIYTSAAQTVIAQLTQNAPPPTATQKPTEAPKVTPTKLSSLPTLPPLGTLAPLKTSTAALGPTNDKCQYITQSPSDNSSVKANSVFNIIWRIKNTGTTTWNTNYYYRFYAAVDKLHIQSNSYPLTTTVAPNGEVELKVVAEASSVAGLYDTNWVLTNPDGRNFCSFNIKVNVAASTSTSSEATAVPATEAHMITYGEEQFTAATTTITYTDGTPIQARIVFPTGPTYASTVRVSITGNNSVVQDASQYSESAGTGYLYAGITHGLPYTFTVTKDAAAGRIYRLEVCDSSVNCW